MWDKSKFLENKLTKLGEGEATYSLREAYKRVIGEYPTKQTLAILIAQTALETGRWKSMHNGNWGNIKSRPNDGRYWTMFECGEIINGKEVIFKPPHDQCKFRAYLTPIDGAEDYIKFLKTTRYTKALAQLQNGKVAEYTTELKKAGYFTANLRRYISTMTKLYNEFMRKMNSLLAWAPPEPEPEPEPVQSTKADTIIPPPPDEPVETDLKILTIEAVKTAELSERKPKKINKSIGLPLFFIALGTIIMAVLRQCQF